MAREAVEPDQAAVRLFEGLAAHLAGEAKSRLESALARVACEPWLTVEAAHAADRHGAVPEGWAVFLERPHKVDLSLVPDGEALANRIVPNGLYFEFKLVWTAGSLKTYCDGLRRDHEKLRNLGVRNGFEVTLAFIGRERCRAWWCQYPKRAQVWTLDEANQQIRAGSSGLDHVTSAEPLELHHDWYDATAGLDLWRHRLTPDGER